MNNEYADINENIDFDKLEDFNKKLKLKMLGRTPQKHHADASGYTQDGRTAIIELKKRNFTLGKYNSIVIESHKLADILLDSICDDKVPLYINFLDDDYVVMFNLLKLKHRPRKHAQRNLSKLYDGYELSVREFLDMRDAWVYKKQDNTYKLIKKGY